MADDVLEIGRKLSDDSGLPRYTNLVGNGEENARKILTAIKDALIIDVFQDEDWEMLRNYTTVSALGGGVTTYDLPSDFDRIINDTIWDNTNFRKARGPVDLREWQAYNQGLAEIAGLETICRLQGDQTTNTKKLTFYPDVSAMTISYYYISNKCVISSGGALQDSINADTDLFVVPTKLVRAAAKWRLLRALGMDFQDERVEYASLLDDIAANDKGGKKINMGSTDRYYPANIPETGFG